jgi:hypothetical protein
LVTIPVGDQCAVAELRLPTDARSLVVLTRARLGDAEIVRVRQAAAAFQARGYGTLVVGLTTQSDPDFVGADTMHERVDDVLAWATTHPETANLTIAVVDDDESIAGRIIGRS